MHVTCAAVVDPNTKKFVNFGYEAFLNGECEDCGEVMLTDPDEVMADIENLWTQHLAKHGKAPRYAYCGIVQLDYKGLERRVIRIGEQACTESSGKVFANCADLSALKVLTIPDLESGREFTVVSIEAMLDKPF